ncbi:MAG: amidohydrolase family protein [Acidimicrobiia bacterium]
MIDLVLKGGTLVDGTGAPRYVADVAINGGRIVGVGKIADTAKRTIDATGLTVAPGFIDIHTHYDAQVLWDGTCSPSPLHGVTSVVAGNCGFTLAPAGPEHADYLTRLLARVEGIELSVLQRAIDWTWKSTSDYFGLFEESLAINAGFYTGHSALRRQVMGERAVGNYATDDEIAAMKALLRESIAAGSLGFSSSNAGTHNDGDGAPVPSRSTNELELLGLCEVLSEFPGTTLEYIPFRAADEMSRMTAMAVTAQRNMNWNILYVTADRPHVYNADLAVSDNAARYGATIRALTLPGTLDTRINLTTSFMLDSLPGWAPVVRAPIEERKRLLADAKVRQALREGAIQAGPRRKELTDWSTYEICETFSPALDGLAGHLIRDIAAMRPDLGPGGDSFDVLMDLVLADDLRTILLPRSVGMDEESWQHRGDVLRDPRVLVGASDAGAHLDMITTFSLPTTVLSRWVRERQVFSLEEGVHQLSGRIADFLGLVDRGRIAEGAIADIVVFDADEVAPGPVTMRNDLPAGGSRLYGGAVGVEHVFVAGTEIVTGTEFTGSAPGEVLKSGKATR